MVVTLYAYRDKTDAIDSIFILYQEWQELLKHWRPISTEFLANTQDPTDMIMLARFPDEDSAWAAAESSAHQAWYVRLVTLSEVGPIVNQYKYNLGG